MTIDIEKIAEALSHPAERAPSAERRTPVTPGPKLRVLAPDQYKVLVKQDSGEARPAVAMGRKRRYGDNLIKIKYDDTRWTGWVYAFRVSLPGE